MVEFESVQTSAIAYTSTLLSYCLACLCAVDLVFMGTKTNTPRTRNQKSEVEHEVEEIPQNKATTARGKGRKWSDAETDQLIDL